MLTSIVSQQGTVNRECKVLDMLGEGLFDKGFYVSSFLKCITDVIGIRSSGDNQFILQVGQCSESVYCYIKERKFLMAGVKQFYRIVDILSSFL